MFITPTRGFQSEILSAADQPHKAHLNLVNSFYDDKHKHATKYLKYNFFLITFAMSHCPTAIHRISNLANKPRGGWKTWIAFIFVYNVAKKNPVYPQQSHNTNPG